MLRLMRIPGNSELITVDELLANGFCKSVMLDRSAKRVYHYVDYQPPMDDGTKMIKSFDFDVTVIKSDVIIMVSIDYGWVVRRHLSIKFTGGETFRSSDWILLRELFVVDKSSQ